MSATASFGLPVTRLCPSSTIPVQEPGCGARVGVRGAGSEMQGAGESVDLEWKYKSDASAFSPAQG